MALVRSVCPLPQRPVLTRQQEDYRMPSIPRKPMAPCAAQGMVLHTNGRPGNGRKRLKGPKDQSSGSIKPNTSKDEKSSGLSDDIENVDELLYKAQEMDDHFKFWTKCIHGQGATVSIRKGNKSVGPTP